MNAQAILAEHSIPGTEATARVLREVRDNPGASGYAISRGSASGNSTRARQNASFRLQQCVRGELVHRSWDGNRQMHYITEAGLAALEECA